METQKMIPKNIGFKKFFARLILCRLKAAQKLKLLQISQFSGEGFTSMSRIPTWNFGLLLQLSMEWHKKRKRSSIASWQGTCLFVFLGEVTFCSLVSCMKITELLQPSKWYDSRLPFPRQFSTPYCKSNLHKIRGNEMNSTWSSYLWH